MSEKKKKTAGVSKIVIILVVLLIVLIGSFVGYIFLFGGASKLHQSSSTSTSNNTSAVTISSADENTYSLDEAIVNLSDTDSQRYVKVKVSLGYDAKNSGLKKELEDETVVKKPILTDAVNGILRSKKASDFTGKGINDIKQQILDAVNPALKKGRISHVYFDELIVQ